LADRLTKDWQYPAQRTTYVTPADCRWQMFFGSATGFEG
jgi:hypothetical protein